MNIMELIKEEVNDYLLREKISDKQKTKKKALQAKGKKRTDDEDDELEKLQHQ